MPNVTGFTAASTQEIEDAIITSAAVVGGHLIFTRHDGSTYDAGDIRGGEQIPHSKAVQVISAGGYTDLTTFNALDVPLVVSGFQKYRADTKLLIQVDTGFFCDDGAGSWEAAIWMAGVNKGVIMNGTGLLDQKSASKELTGIAAGTHTIHIYYRMGAGSPGTLFEGTAGNRNSLLVTETF